MAGRRLSDRIRLVGLGAIIGLGSLWHGSRRIVRRIRWRMQPRFERLEIAPEDLRPADERRALDILDGIFELAGVAVDCRGRSPFAVIAPSPGWEAELHAFSWLRDLSAADQDVAPERARVLMVEWSRYGSTHTVSNEPDVIARRLRAFLHEAPLLLTRANAAQHERFMAYLEADARHLRLGLGEGPPTVARACRSAILAEVLLSIAGAETRAQPVLRQLDRDLAHLVLGDGTPADRNPASVVELIAHLLPLKQVMAERGQPVSRIVMGALDRLMPMLRFFRHADGAMALFNGGRHIPPDMVAAIFLQDDARARPPGQAPYGGYQRLEAGRTVMMMDTGGPPPVLLSGQAHAAPLALEFSSGQNRFVVSTGSALHLKADWAEAVRETAAHSTVTMDERSLGDFLNDGALARSIGPVLASRPWEVTVSRQEHQGMIAVVAAHDGYKADFGFSHERTLRLAAMGDRIDGRDRIFGPGRRDRRVPLALRFHIHPDIRVSRLQNGVVQLIAENGEAWEFHVKGGRARIEPSVFLGDAGPPRPNDQIVVLGEGEAEFRWVFLRSAEPRALRRGILAVEGQG